MTTEEKLTPITDKIYRDVLFKTLERIHHEDTLINQRFGWLLTSQTIFCALIGVLFQKLNEQNPITVIWIAPIALIPLATCLINYTSILAAVIAIYNFCKRLDGDYKQYSEYSREMILGPTVTHLMGQASPIFIPLGFVAIWIFAFLFAIIYGAIHSVTITGAIVLAVVIAFIPASLLLLGLVGSLMFLWKRTFPYPLYWNSDPAQSQ